MTVQAQTMKRYETEVAYSTFDDALSLLEEASYRVISLAENAQVKVQQGPGAFRTDVGNFVREGVMYIPGGKNFLVPVSPILNNPQRAVQAHAEGKEYEILPTEVKPYILDRIEFPQTTTKVPTDRFGEEEYMIEMFGSRDLQKAREYGEFLHSLGIREIPIYVLDQGYVKRQRTPFVRQLWFSSLREQSATVANDRSLHEEVRVGGIKGIV